MLPKHLFPLLLLVLLGLALAACGGAAAPQAAAPTEIPPVIADVNIVAEGRLVPRESVEIAFASGGEVAEVLVEEGDVVAAGDVLARLGNREPLESSVAAAEMEQLSARQELLSAQQALDTLNDDLPDAQTQALDAVTAARDEVRDAERELHSINTPAEDLDVDAAWATVVLTRDELEDARKDFEPYERKSEDNVIRAALLNNLAAAQDTYDKAVARYNNLAGISGSEFDRSQAEAELAIAQSRLEIAEQDYDMLMEGPDPAEVALAESRIDAAEGRIAAAEVALQAAQAALADLDLVSTIAGTVVDMDLIEGEQVTAGAPVAQLADFSQWYVETDNLTEIEVVDIADGQKVTITPDALPDVELTGTVESIADVFEEKRGDVTYTVRILLDEIQENLRWGMTVGVTFEE
jgi:multidrug resistance efflux pump